MRKLTHCTGPATRLAAGMALALALALTGCSAFDGLGDMFGEPSPPRDSTGAHPVVQNDKTSQDTSGQSAQPKQESSGGFFDRIFGTPSPPRDSTGAHPMAESKTIPGENKPYPNVGSVPARPMASPEAERQKMVQGLVADRADARYTGQELRRQEPQAEPQETPSVARATPAPAPAAQPAKPPAQTAMAPESVPKAPPPAPAQTAMAPAPVPAAPSPTPAQTAMASQPAPAAPPAPPPASVMAPPPGPSLMPAAPVRPENPAGGISGPSFGLPPPDIDLTQNQFASAAPVGPGGGMSSYRVATIHFGVGSARLDARDERQLRRVIQLYKRQGGHMTVVGHSSSFTRNMKPLRHQIVNFSLSVERAQAVARALERMGVPSGSIEVAALSDSQPVYYESMPAGQAANRRAEIFLRR